MKTIAISIFLLGTIFCASAQLVTNEPARLKWQISWFEGTTNSGTCGHTITFQPDSIHFGDSGADILTSRGREHELKWTFIGRNDNKDVYRFTFHRMTKAGSPEKSFTSKDIQFDGKRTVVFRDDLHTVVMETPSAEESKKAYGAR